MFRFGIHKKIVVASDIKFGVVVFIGLAYTLILIDRLEIHLTPILYYIIIFSVYVWICLKESFFINYLDYCIISDELSLCQCN